MKTQIAKYLVLIEYFENVYTAHSNLEIQYKPYQNSNSRFHRSRKTTLNFVKNSKKPKKPKAILIKKNKDRGITLSGLNKKSSTKLQ